MLTREMEGMTIKCGNYWSDSVYGPLRLSLVSTTAAESNTSRDPTNPSKSEAPSFFPVQTTSSAAPEQTSSEETIKRVFHLSHTAYPQLPPRRVVQLQYLAWPDFNVPNDSWGLLKLIKQVEEEVENSERDRLEWEMIKSKRAATVKRNPVSALASSACTPSVPVPAPASALGAGEEDKSHASNESVAGDTDSELVSTPSTDDMDSETGIVWNALAKRPILLHCSAGVGRTGGYIAVDAVLDGVKNEMRKRREAAGIFATTTESRSRSGSRRLESDSDGASPHEEAVAMDVDDGGLVMSLPVGTDNLAGRQVGLSVHVPVVGISPEEKERRGGDDSRSEAPVEESRMEVDEQKQPSQVQPSDSQSPWLMHPHSQGLMKWTPGVGATVQSSRPHISHHFSHTSNASSLGPSRRRPSTSTRHPSVSPPSRSPSEPPESGSGSSGSSLSLPFANPSNPATGLTTPFSFSFSKPDPSRTSSSESLSSSSPSSSSNAHPIVKLPVTTPNAARHRTWSAPNHTPMFDKNKTPSAAITPGTFNLKMPAPKAPGASSVPRFGGIPSRPIHLGSKPSEPPSSVFALHHHISEPSSLGRSSLNSPLAVASERYTSSPLALGPEPPTSRSGSASNPRQRYHSSPVTGFMQQVQQSASLPVPLRHPHAHVQQSQAQTHPVLPQESPQQQQQQHPQPEKQSSSDSIAQEAAAETFDYTKPRRLHSARTTPLMLSDLDEPVRRVVEDMREQRMSLCQSLRQYVFVHRAILEGVLQLVDEEREMYGDVWMDADLGEGKEAVAKALGPAVDLAGPSAQMGAMPLQPIPNMATGEPSPSSGTIHQPDQPSIIISSSPSPSKGKRGASPTELPIKDKMGVLKLSKRPSIKRVQGQRSGDGVQSESPEGREGSSSGGALARVGEGVKMQQPMHDSFMTRSLPPGLAPP